MRSIPRSVETTDAKIFQLGRRVGSYQMTGKSLLRNASKTNPFPTPFPSFLGSLAAVFGNTSARHSVGTLLGWWGAKFGFWLSRGGTFWNGSGTSLDWNYFSQPSETLAFFGIMRACLRHPLKPLNTILLGCLRRVSPSFATHEA